VLLNGALINLKSAGQFVDRNAVEVSLDQLLHLGRFEAPANPSLGSSFGRFGPTWDHFEEGPETFSLVRMVQVTPHYVHHQDVLRTRRSTTHSEQIFVIEHGRIGWHTRHTHQPR
jgi:hypothetical protein